MTRRDALRTSAAFALAGVDAPAQEAPAARDGAESSFRVALPPHREAGRLLPDSPFGVNTQIFQLDAPDIEKRLGLMQEAGIKWGRHDFAWRNIERERGQYDLDRYEQVADLYRKYGLLMFGNLAYAPPFHDPRTPEGVEAYCALARAAVKRFRRKVDHWQIWNEPNGGFWNGSPEDYARMLSAVGRAIHEASPDAKVLALNMAFCDVLWAETVMKLVPYDAFDIVCFHPYRPPSPPEETFDWWTLDRYQKVALSPWHKGRVPADYPLIRMSFLEQTDALVQLMSKFGRPKPLWITEMNWNTPISGYGTPELKQADLLVRFYALALGSQRIQKIFPWGFRDTGAVETDMGHMVGLVRQDLTPRYSFYAQAWMARLLEGKRWARNEIWGPYDYAAVFADEAADEETVVAWTTRPYAYLEVPNRKGLVFHDIFGTRRSVFADPKRPRVVAPLGGSPAYITGARGLKTAIREGPGEHWI